MISGAAHVSDIILFKDSHDEGLVSDMNYWLKNIWMSYITICDARHPVTIDVKNGDSISLTSMSLIYDFYNITKPQEIVKLEHIKDENDDVILFKDYANGVNFADYYDITS